MLVHAIVGIFGGMHMHMSTYKGACTQINLTSPASELKLIAFELAGEDRDRRETPVWSRLKIAFFALHKRG